MLKKGFLKPELSISNIGKRKFWTGIILGFCTAFILSYFFNYSREALRLISFLRDPIILSVKDFRLYDLFFTFFATSLGFGVTIIYWLTGNNNVVKKRYLKVFAISNAAFITFSALLILARFGSNLSIIPYGLYGYDNHLNIIKDHWLLLVLTPIYIFFTHWISIRLIFRTKNWMLISTIIYSLTAFYLYKTTYVDREILNQAFNNQNKERFEYIDREFLKARQMGIFFSDSIRQILRKKYAKRTADLVIKLKHAFMEDKMVSLDTLILEKIVIHNMNHQGFYWYGTREERDSNWSYALPEQIYYQLQKKNVTSPETQLLFEILHEQASLFLAEEINDAFYSGSTYYGREKSFYKWRLLTRTNTIQSRLIQVIAKLKADKKYEKYKYLIPDFKFDDNDGRQEYYQLNLDDK